MQSKMNESLKELFGEHLYLKSVSELIEIALQIDCGMYDCLPEAWRNPGISGLFSFRLLADALWINHAKCSKEVQAFLQKIEESTKEALLLLEEKGAKTFIKPIVNKLFEYCEGFRRINYSQERVERFILATKEISREGQLVYRPQDGRFFVLVDNHFIQKAYQVEGVGDLPRAVIGHAHITVNEGMSKEESEKWFEIMKQRFGEAAEPRYRAKQDGLFYFNKLIKIDGIGGVYEGVPKTNSRIVKTCHLQIQSQDLMALANENDGQGLGPRLKDYTYHVTFYEQMRAPYPGLLKINLMIILAEFGLSARLMSILNKVQAGLVGEDIRNPLNRDANSALIRAYAQLGKKYFEQGLDAEALRYYKEAHKTAETTFGSESIDFARFCIIISRSFYYTLKFDNPLLLTTIQKAISIYEKHLSTGDNKIMAHLGRAHMWLGCIYYKKRELSNAVMAHKKSLEYRTLAITDPVQLSKKILKVMAHLGNDYLEQHEYERALTEQFSALKLSIKYYGEFHKNTSWIYSNIARIYLAQRLTKEALFYSEKVSGIYDKIFDIHHPVIFKNIIQLADLYLQDANFEKAKEKYSIALEILEQKHTDKQLYFAKCYNGLADVYFQLGDLDLMEQNLNKAVLIDQGIHLANDYIKLGDLCYRRGDFLKAIDYYRNLALPIFLSNQQFKVNESCFLCQDKLMRALLAQAAKSPVDVDLLDQAREIGESLRKISLGVLVNEIPLTSDITIYDLIDYGRILAVLGQIYVLKKEPLTAAHLYLEEARRWKRIPSLSLRWAEKAIECIKRVPEQHQLLAEIYYLISELTKAQHRYRYSLIQLRKALELDPRVEWQQQVQIDELTLNTLSQQMDQDLFVQLERAQEAYHLLQLKYFDDLSVKGPEHELSESSKNLTTELLIKLRNLLDMSFGRFVKDAIWGPNKREPKNTYYPYDGSKKAMMNRFVKEGVIYQPRFTASLFNFSDVTQNMVIRMADELRRCGYVDQESRLTQKAFDDSDLTEFSDQMSPFIPYLSAYIRHAQIGDPLGRRQIGENRIAAALVNNRIDSRSIVNFLIRVGYVEGVPGSDEYLIINQPILAVGETFQLKDPIDDALIPYRRLINLKLTDILQKKVSFQDVDFKQCYEALLREQPFSYYGQNENRKQSAWKFSWLEKCNVIQVESKHVRLTPQFLDSNLQKMKAGMQLKRVRINIEYQNMYFNNWSFIHPLEEQTSNLTDVEKVILSKAILKFLRDQGYINEKVVSHLLAKELVRQKKRGAEPEVISEYENKFLEQLKADIKRDHPEWERYASALGDFLILKLYQRARVISVPDLLVDATWLLETTLEKVREQVMLLGKARHANQAMLAPAIPVILNERLGLYSKTCTELNQLLEETKVSLDSCKKQSLTVQSLATRNGLLLRLSAISTLLGTTIESALEWRNSARQLAPHYPWLAIQYYLLALRGFKSTLSGYDYISNLSVELAELYQSHGLYEKARQMLHKAKDYIINNPDLYYDIVTQIKVWKKQDISRRMETDHDIDSQLNHVREVFQEGQYLAFNLYWNPKDHYLNYRLQNMVVEMVIKLRHLLDQVFGEFTRVCLYNNQAVTMIEANFPCEKSEKALKEYLISQILDQEADAFNENNHPFFKNIPEYQDVYTRILQLQDFGVGKDSWYSQIVNLSNKSKHVRMVFPSVELLEERKRISSGLDDFYPFRVSEELPWISIFPLLSRSQSEIRSFVELLYKHINAKRTIPPQKQKKARIPQSSLPDFSFFPRQSILTDIDREWYSNDEIDQLMQHYFTDRNDVAIFYGMRGDDWRRSGALTENLIEFYQQRREKLASGEAVSRRIVIPINLGEQHWVLVCLNFAENPDQAPDIFYIDPLGQQPDYDIVSIFRHPKLFPGVELIPSDVVLQHDGYNCGPWIVEIARYFMNKGHLPGDGEIDIQPSRAIHRGILATNESKSINSMV